MKEQKIELADGFWVNRKLVTTDYKGLPLKEPIKVIKLSIFNEERSLEYYIDNVECIEGLIKHLEMYKDYLKGGGD